VESNAVVKKDDDIALWHKLLGHISIETIKQAVEKEMVNNIAIKDYTMNRKCKEGKMAQKPYKSNQTEEKYGLIHWDICGPMKKESIGESTYPLLAIDDRNSITKGYYLKFKSETVNEMDAYVNEVENQIQRESNCSKTWWCKRIRNYSFEGFLRQKGNQATNRCKICSFYECNCRPNDKSGSYYDNMLDKPRELG